MKRVFIIVLSVVVVFVALVSLFCVFKTKTIYASDITILTNKISLQVNEKIKLSNQNYLVLPNNYTEKTVFSSDNESVASVGVFDGVVTANKVGCCNIIIFLKTNENDVINKKIQVEVVKEKIYPTEVSLNDEDIEIYIGESVKLFTSITGETNVLPTVYSQNNCVKYDFETDTITAIKVGSDKLTIKYVLSSLECKTFEIDIVVKQKDVFTQNITIDMSVKNYYYAEYFTSSSKALSDIAIVEGEDVVEVAEHEYKHFVIVALKKGKAKIVVDSPSATNYFIIEVV
ncbi:MAG: Ig-like domain-containing protein [Christensenellales bacterium]